MLINPTRGFAYSATKINVDLDIVADWIEASILFTDEELSINDVVDVLHESQVCKTQSIGQEIANGAWRKLKARKRWIGVVPYTLDSVWIKRAIAWQEIAGYTFCLLLSLAPAYSGKRGWWTTEFGQASITEQGRLFEELTYQAFCTLFGTQWGVLKTGWTRENTNGLRDVVNRIADELREEILDIDRWLTPHSKELGLDLLCYRKFPDGRVGIPVYMLQCASGDDWVSKKHTPNLNIWKKLLNFYNMPMKAFSMPFSISNDDLFVTSCAEVGGLFLDRCRLLSAASIDPNWLPTDLADELNAWSMPKVEALLEKSV